ncbi:hypothetical protein DY000_02016061 [Brassica cretica]|uniref:NET domain-containing protein n=1 Tax=Brassica cretica TaxID=69181 RepID=A0ABQ7D0V0_BRACR|nr:hypothetical protein DY000_02016061 [Brassica cretica]
MRHRSTETPQHRSTLIFIRQVENEHRQTLPTTHRSTLTSILHEKEIPQLAVGQMIDITRAMQDPYGYAREIDGHELHISIEDIEDILHRANGADNLFMQQLTIPAHQQRVTNESYDTTGGVDNRFKQKNRHHTRPSIDVDDPT